MQKELKQPNQVVEDYLSEARELTKMAKRHVEGIKEANVNSELLKYSTLAAIDNLIEAVYMLYEDTRRQQ